MTDNRKKSAVLLLLFPKEGEPYLIFTKRTDEVETHKGQISFPGGTLEESDDSLLATALRETQEELGIDVGPLRILGELEVAYTPASDYWIWPFVAYSARRPSYKVNVREVAEIIEAPVAQFLKPAAFTAVRRESAGETRTLYYCYYDGHEIWGVTAKILRDFTLTFWPRLAAGEIDGWPVA